MRLVLPRAVLSILAVACLMGSSGQAEETQKILLTDYRVGPFAPNGIPIFDGILDYVTLVNEREGGVNGVKLVPQECETQFEPSRGIECYERYKNLNANGLPGLLPLDGGLAFALYDRANTDEIPLLTPGYGRLEGAVGSYFPYEFPIVGNDWEQTNAIMNYIAQREGGFDKLRGRKIALVYLDNAYGKAPHPVLDDMKKRYGIEWEGYPVAGSAMVEQSSIWLQIRRSKPDYVLLWGWGVMTPTAIKEAANVKFPLDRLIGNWWSAAEPDVTPVSAVAKGYVGATFRMPGIDFDIYKDLNKYVFGPGKAKSTESERGTILYNQGLFFAMLQTEGIRKAMSKYGNQPISGEQMRWGLEHVDLSEPRLKQLGLSGIVSPLKLTCEDHAGGGQLRLIQWDGNKWSPISGWLSGKTEFSEPLLQASAEKLAKEMGRTKRECKSEE